MVDARFDDKVVIVTGASRGVGKVTALAFGKAGAKVVVAARSDQTSRLPGTIHETVDQIRSEGGEAIAIRTDVGDEASVENMVRQTLDAFGKIDVLVNNAVMSWTGPLVNTPTRRWEAVLRVSLTGPFYCCRAVLPHMIDRRSGAIVNLSSPCGEIDGPRYLKVDETGPEATDGPAINVSYSASKAGLERLSNALSYEVNDHNIAVNAIKPRFVLLTEGTRMLCPDEDWSRWRKPEDFLVKGIMFLASRNASLTGQIFYDDEVCEKFGL